jgi:hypothetical protein
MKENEYLKLKRQIQAEYQKKLDALEMVWKMAKEETKKEWAGKGKADGHGELLKAVQDSIAAFTGDFNVRDVEEKMKEMHPSIASRTKRSSISTVLKRLADNHDIAQIEKGTGRAASKYRLSA